MTEGVVDILNLFKISSYKKLSFISNYKIQRILWDTVVGDIIDVPLQTSLYIGTLPYVVSYNF